MSSYATVCVCADPVYEYTVGPLPSIISTEPSVPLLALLLPNEPAPPDFCVKFDKMFEFGSCTALYAYVLV